MCICRHLARWGVLFALAVAAASAASGADKPEKFLPPNCPISEYDVDHSSKPGHRMEMPKLVSRFARRDIVIKANVPGWTKQGWQTDQMGTFLVGDQISFSVVIGDRNSRLFGSVKDGRDGGRLVTTVHWMDESGKKVLAEDAAAVKGSCTCWGNYDLKLNIPSTARTARHRLHILYVNDRLKMKVRKDLYFNVNNDGAWKTDPLIEAVRAKYPTVLIVQNGRPCEPLGIRRYAGAHDTYMHATHRVPDRNTDFVSYGGLTYLSIGPYGQVMRTLIKFDLSRIPAAGRPKEAYLQIYLCSKPGRFGGRAPEIEAFEVLKEWGAGRGDGSRWRKDPVLPGEASWLCNRRPTKWHVGGCGAPGRDRSEKAVGHGPALKGSKGWATIRLEAKLIRKWIENPASNHGLLLVDKNEGKNAQGSAKYRSSEFEDAVMRPRLILAMSSAIAAATTRPSPTGAACPLPPSK